MVICPTNTFPAHKSTCHISSYSTALENPFIYETIPPLLPSIMTNIYDPWAGSQLANSTWPSGIESQVENKEGGDSSEAGWIMVVVWVRRSEGKSKDEKSWWHGHLCLDLKSDCPTTNTPHTFALPPSHLLYHCRMRCHVIWQHVLFLRCHSIDSVPTAWVFESKLEPVTLTSFIITCWNACSLRQVWVCR